MSNTPETKEDDGKAIDPEVKIDASIGQKPGSEEKGASLDEKKKMSPFLEVKSESTPCRDGEEEDSSAMQKQRNDIDEQVGNRPTFNKVCKLYFLSKRTSKLESRGEGKMMILKDNSNLYKILMIRDKLMLKGCNHYIAESCPLTKAARVKNSWVWVALNDQCDADDVEPKTTYFAVFNSEEDSNAFEEAYNDGQKRNSKELSERKNASKEEQAEKRDNDDKAEKSGNKVEGREDSAENK